MKPSFHPLARRDLRDAAAWYGDQTPNLARRFRDDVQETLSRIVVNPHQFPLVWNNSRRALLSSFPYSIIFEAVPGEICVLSVLHAKRDPRHGGDREMPLNS